MPSPVAWQREADRYQRIADRRREQEAVRKRLRRMYVGLAWDTMKLLVVVAALAGWVLWLLGAFR